MIDPLDLQGLEDAYHRGVVPAVGHRAGLEAAGSDPINRLTLQRLRKSPAPPHSSHPSLQVRKASMGCRLSAALPWKLASRVQLDLFIFKNSGAMQLIFQNGRNVPRPRRAHGKAALLEKGGITRLLARRENRLNTRIKIQSCVNNGIAISYHRRSAAKLSRHGRVDGKNFFQGGVDCQLRRFRCRRCFGISRSCSNHAAGAQVACSGRASERGRCHRGAPARGSSSRRTIGV